MWVVVWVVWQTRGQHRRLSPKIQCGLSGHVTPRVSGVILVEEEGGGVG